MAFLKSRQCGAAQRFLFGKAVPIDQFNVQGFHFGKAMTERELASGFRELADAARDRVGRVH